MLFSGHLPPAHRADVQHFPGWAVVADTEWRVWHKPPGCSMVYIFGQGAGGGGGTGVIGANSAAAGGGGGGSGAQATILLPACLLPDVLYVSAGAPKLGTGLVTRVAIQPNASTGAHLVLTAAAGTLGGNAAAGTGGGAGSGGAASSLAANSFSGLGLAQYLSGQPGSAGGTTGSSVAVAVSTSGIMSTAGTGGAGLGVAGSNGSAAGSINPPTPALRYLTQPGGTGTTSATTPPGRGSPGFRNFTQGLHFGYGGTGGGSTHGSATGAGLVQAAGGDGNGFGCGGGGMGGALTGSTPAARASRGGPGYVCIIAW